MKRKFDMSTVLLNSLVHTENIFVVIIIFWVSRMQESHKSLKIKSYDMLFIWQALHMLC